MGACGAKIPADSRFWAAREVLSFGQETGRLMPRHRQDPLGLRALELAHDLKVISSALPQKRIADVREDLEIMAKGALEPTADEDWRALQRQSQLIVRAVLVRAGLSASHPSESPSKTKPDLLWENGNSLYGIEVKRPRKMKNALPNFTKGTQQLHNYGVKGGIVMDLTDCVRSLPPDECDSAMSAAAESLYAEAYTGNGGFRSGYSHVMLAAVYARVPWTSAKVEESNYIGVRYIHRIGVLSVAYGSLQGHHGRSLRSARLSGLELIARDLDTQRSALDEV